MASKNKAQDVLLCALISFLVLVVVSFAGYSGYAIWAAVTGDEAQLLPDSKGGVTRTLFPTVAQVIDLTSADFDGPANRCPWIVTFYSDGCGHCRSAAPKIGNMARQLARLGDVTASAEELATDGLTGAALAEAPLARAVFDHEVVLSGVVNCVQFGRACSKEGVNGVPTVMLYLPSQRPTATTKVAATRVRKAAQFGAEEATVLAVGRTWTDYRGQMLKDWTDDDTRACRDLYRSLVSDKRARITAAAIAANTTTSAPPRSGGTTAPTASRFQEYRDFSPSDVANAFFYTMYYEVALKGIPDRASYAALVNVLWRVHDHLPGLPASSLLLFLTKHLPMDTKGGFVTDFNASDWQQAVLEAGIPIRGKPDALEWRTCRGSSWTYRGFPCGMWLLYHSLTVAESTQALANTSSSLSSAAPASATELAHTPRDAVLKEILDYARHFFTCEPCRQHFMRFAPTPDEDPALQLWRVHNRVNFYLQRPEQGNGDAGASDPAVPKRQFPTVSACRACYKAPDTMPAEVTDTNLADGVYNLPEVLAFLRTRYAWRPETIWTLEPSSTGLPHRGVLGGQFEPHKREGPTDFSVMMTMLTVVVFVGCGLVYSLTRHHRRSRTSLRQSKPIV